MAQILGATNIADGNADQGPFPGYAQLSTEYILNADPDFVFTITQGSPTPMPEAMKDDPIWSSLTAFQNGHVMELDVHCSWNRRGHALSMRCSSLTIFCTAAGCKRAPDTERRGLAPRPLSIRNGEGGEGSESPSQLGWKGFRVRADRPLRKLIRIV